MRYFNSIIDVIGNTPLFKLRQLAKDVPGTLLAKVEYFNPGHSVKDRMALKIVEDAEKRGMLSPGGTIIEATSGNTGFGLALIGAAKGYRCIFTISNKQSNEKINILRALGAEVVVCPGDVPHEDPRSYCSVAHKLSKENPHAFFPYQYDNPNNAQAHYETTGPEIWAQTEGKITHYAAGVGTGGTICGTSRFLKEKNKDIVTIGIDPIGSIFKKMKDKGHYTEDDIEAYGIEGIGGDFMPKNVDMGLIDEVVQVSDKDAALCARLLAKKEGIFTGWSCGAALHGALSYAKKHLSTNDVMVIVLPDHGSRYVSKIYNDEWMKQNNYL